jgi:type I restriction enzyme, S subunit
MKGILAQIGIKDETFDLLTVRQLVAQRVLEKPLDGNHGELHPKGEDFVAAGVPFIMATDVRSGRVDFATCKFITPKQADSLRKGFARNGDVLLTHKATMGRTAIVKYDKHPYVMLTPQVTYYRVANRERLDNRYLRYYFESELFQKTLHLWADSGSTRAYLGIIEQQKLPIIVPPIAKQQKIAAVLSAYDDLIENNSQRVALIEKITEEIYREWFVRFRCPGYEQAKLIKGVPQGWRVAELRDVASLNPSSVSRLNKSESILYVDIGSVSTNRIDEVTLYPSSEAPGRARRRVKHGDIIWSSVRPANRAFCLIVDPPEHLIVSTGFAVIRPNAETPFTFLFFAVTSNPFVDQMTTVAKGAAYPATSFDDFKKAKLLIPSDSLLKRFHENVEPLFRQKHALDQHSDRLRQARDLLLPRLMSGQLSVENLEIHFPPGMAEELNAKPTASTHA